MEMLPELLWKMSWQTAIVAAAVWIITRFARNAPASWRHALWLVVLIKFFIPPFAYLPSQLAIEKTPAPSTYARVVTADPPVVHSESKTSPDADVSSHQPTVRSRAAELATIAYWNMGILTGWAWTAAVSICAIVLLVRYRRQKRLVASARVADDEYTGLLRECAATLGIHRLPRILLSDRVATPMLTGLRRPTILLPTEITESCTSSDLRAILMHELAHVRRRDMSVIWLQQIAQILFFFHPVVWIVGHELKREREIACDEMVLSTAGIPHKDYASGYVAALRLASDAPRSAVSLAMAEPFEVERRRVQLMLRAVMPRFTVRWAIALAVMAAIGVPTFMGYSASEESLAVKTKVTGDGFMLEYKNPPTWKWKDLTFTVKSIGRSTRLERVSERGKGMAVYAELRRPSDRWSISRNMEFGFGRDKPQDSFQHAKYVDARTEVYQPNTDLPAKGTMTFNVYATVTESLPFVELNEGPHAIADVKRLLSLRDNRLFLTTADWRMGRPYTGYVCDYTSALFPNSIRSARKDARYVSLRLFYAEPPKPDRIYPSEYTLYDSTGRSVKLEELYHDMSTFTYGSDWNCEILPYLGMRVATTPETRATKGGVLRYLKVIGVDPDGPAYKAGVSPADVLVELEGIEWRADGGSSHSYSMETRRLVVLRNGKKLVLGITPIDDPLWTVETSDAKRALAEINTVGRRYKDSQYSDSLLYSKEPVPADFVPAKFGFKISFGGRTIKEVEFQIKDIPIPAEFWERMDEQKPNLPPWKRD